MPISTRAILLRKIGNPSGLILDGNLTRLSGTPIRLPRGLEVLYVSNLSHMEVFFSK